MECEFCCSVCIEPFCLNAWVVEQNLLGKLSGYFNERMIDGGLLKILTNMRERKWTDEDIAKSIQSVRDVLIREYKELKYVSYFFRGRW